MARETVIDFTKPFMNLGISILFKKPEVHTAQLFRQWSGASSKCVTKLKNNNFFKAILRDGSALFFVVVVAWPQIRSYSFFKIRHSEVQAINDLRQIRSPIIFLSRNRSHHQNDAAP
jgi:hypothetical protein